jgi:hypothetical protein
MIRSSLARHQPNPMDAEQVKRDGWHKDRILVIAAKDERLTWDERQLVVNLGNRLYGKGKA